MNNLKRLNLQLSEILETHGWFLANQGNDHVEYKLRSDPEIQLKFNKKVFSVYSGTQNIKTLIPIQDLLKYLADLPVLTN